MCQESAANQHAVAVARKSGIHRVTVYKTLQTNTESSFTTMHALLKACNVRLEVSNGPILGRIRHRFAMYLTSKCVMGNYVRSA